MHYVLRNQVGKIIGLSENAPQLDASVSTEVWERIETNHPDVVQFMEEKLNIASAFRESDIHLARVLEDLITLLVERNVIFFTDLPAAAQKRLNERQSMRKKSQLNNMIDESKQLF